MEELGPCFQSSSHPPTASHVGHGFPKELYGSWQSDGKGKCPLCFCPTLHIMHPPDQDFACRALVRAIPCIVSTKRTFTEYAIPTPVSVPHKHYQRTARACPIHAYCVFQVRRSTLGYSFQCLCLQLSLDELQLRDMDRLITQQGHHGATASL
jgi:hypothetical protein